MLPARPDTPLESSSHPPENKKARSVCIGAGLRIRAVVVFYAIRHPAPVRENAKNRNEERGIEIMCGRLYACRLEQARLSGPHQTNQDRHPGHGAEREIRTAGRDCRHTE